MRNAYRNQVFPSVARAQIATKPNIALVHSSMLPDSATEIVDVCLYIQSIAKELELIAESIGQQNLACTLMVAAAAAGAEAKSHFSAQSTPKHWTGLLTMDLAAWLPARIPLQEQLSVQERKMPKSPIEYTEDNSGSTFYQIRTLPAREALTCVASVAAELQAIASRAGMDLPALLLGEAAVEARMDVNRAMRQSW